MPVFLDEIEAFPLGGHDDQVDALSGAFMRLRGGGEHDPKIHQLIGARRRTLAENPLGLDENDPKYWDTDR